MFGKLNYFRANQPFQSGKVRFVAGEGLQGRTCRICGAGETKRGADGRHEGQGEVDGNQAERAEAQDHLAEYWARIGVGFGGISDG